MKFYMILGPNPDVVFWRKKMKFYMRLGPNPDVREVRAWCRVRRLGAKPELQVAEHGGATVLRTWFVTLLCDQAIQIQVNEILTELNVCPVKSPLTLRLHP